MYVLSGGKAQWQRGAWVTLGVSILSGGFDLMILTCAKWWGARSKEREVGDRQISEGGGALGRLDHVYLGLACGSILRGGGL